MDIKKSIYLAILWLMLLSVFIFRDAILKLNDMQLFVTFVVAFVILLVVTYHAVKYGLKESEVKDISINRSWLILVTPIIYFGIALIFGAIGMKYIAILMGSLGFIMLGGYTIYLSKQGISKGKMQTIFGYYDKKKNYKKFLMITIIYIIFGILEIGFGIIGLATLL